MIAIIDELTGVVEKLVSSTDGHDLTGKLVREEQDSDHLPTLKSSKWDIMKQFRESEQNQGVSTPWGLFDSDQEARTNVMGAVTAAIYNQESFSIVWTLKDNTRVTLTATEIIQVGLLIAERMDQIHQKSRLIKQLIEQSDTIAELENISWNSV